MNISGSKFLDDEMLTRLRKHCKGCRYFKPDSPTKDICTIVGWYNVFNKHEVIQYVKYCPCNKKCLVKAACTEVTCPMWLSYVKNIMEEKNFKLGG